MLTSVGEDCNNFIAVHAHQCPLLYNRSGMTIAQHLWIMSKLLSMKEPITDNKKEPKRDPAVLSKRLQLHVIATCFPKMLRRFKQPASRLFIESLESVKAWEFDEDKRGQPSKKEIGNDREFVA